MTDDRFTRCGDAAQRARALVRPSKPAQRETASVLIARDQQIAGLPAPRVRDLMRRIRLDAVTPGFIGELWGLSEREAGRIVDRLAGEGLLCRVNPADRAPIFIRYGEVDEGKQPLDLWGTTIAGNALAKARIGKPMPRGKAQALLDGLIARAVAINEDPHEVYWVEVVEVFGSFADPNCEEVGDVDLRVLFDRRVDGGRYIELAEEAARAAEAGGRYFSTQLDRITHLENELRRRLKGRSPRLDVQFDLGRKRPLPRGGPTQVVYSRSAE